MRKTLITTAVLAAAASAAFTVHAGAVTPARHQAVTTVARVGARPHTPTTTVPAPPPPAATPAPVVVVTSTPPPPAVTPTRPPVVEHATLAPAVSVAPPTTTPTTTPAPTLNVTTDPASSGDPTSTTVTQYVVSWTLDVPGDSTPVVDTYGGSESQCDSIEALWAPTVGGAPPASVASLWPAGTTVVSVTPVTEVGESVTVTG